MLLERCICCKDASVTVDDLYFNARLLVRVVFCGFGLLFWKILFIFLYCDWVDDTELYFLDEVVLSTFCADAEQWSSLPDETEEEFEIISAMALPLEPPSGGDLGGCK